MDLGREGGLAVQPVAALISLSPCLYAKYEREIPKIKTKLIINSVSLLTGVVLNRIY